MKSHRAGDGERILAVFIDFENLALGFGNRRDRFTIEKVLERLVEKGKIVAKKAYADWSRFGNYAASLHQSAVELVEIPKRTQTGKNSADIRMVVDAMDLAFSKDHIDTFVIVSGDSDFSPLVSKLKELGKHVIGLGLSESTSELLRDNCDEFIYYEDLDRAPIAPISDNPAIPEVKRKAFALLIDSLLALRRENKEVIFSSMVKDTMKRKKPSFNEEYHGYRTFTELLEDAQRHGLVELEKHKTSGTYVVTRFGSEPRTSGGNALNGGPPSRLPAALPPARSVQPPALRPAASEPPRRSAESSEPRRIAESPEPRRGSRPARGPEPRPTPVPAPLPPPPPPQYTADVELDVEDELPLGRALIEEIAEIDEIDDVPSYRSRKPTDPPSGRVPQAPAASTPADRPRSRGGSAKPAAAKPATTPKPTQSVAAPKREAPAKPTRTAAKPEEPPVRRAKPEPTPPARPTPPPAPPTRPASTDDSDFGAGLDL